MSYFEQYGQDYISSMNNAFKDAKLRDGNGRIDLPDGMYQMYIYRVYVKNPPTADAYPRFLMQLTLLAGEYGGQSVYKYYSLEPDPKRLSILKNDLNVLGVQIEQLDDLENEEKMSVLLDQIVEVKVKHTTRNGKTYQNLFIQRVVGHIGNAPGSQTDDDGLPWA